LYTQESNNRLPTMYDAPVNPPAVPGFPPPGSTMDAVLRRELGNPGVLRCISDNQRLFELTRSSYSWNVLLNGQHMDRLSVLQLDFESGKIPMVSDKESFHRARGSAKARNYLYVDGHIRNLLVVEGTFQAR
jgi:prepilin-type processing-associated H-X9-DG protein